MNEPNDPAQKQLFPIIKYFKYDHLPDHLQAILKPFADLALNILNTSPGNAEKAAGLRKLLEAKDCIVRANIK